MDISDVVCDNVSGDDFRELYAAPVEGQCFLQRFREGTSLSARHFLF